MRDAPPQPVPRASETFRTKRAREWLARTGFGKYEVDPPPMSLLRIGQSYARQCYFLQCAKSNLSDAFSRVPLLLGAIPMREVENLPFGPTAR